MSVFALFLVLATGFVIESEGSGGFKDIKDYKDHAKVTYQPLNASKLND